MFFLLAGRLRDSLWQCIRIVQIELRYVHHGQYFPILRIHHQNGYAVRLFRLHRLHGELCRIALNIDIQTYIYIIAAFRLDPFLSWGMRIGVDRYYDYFQKFGLLTKTGVDLPGEAGTIMHKKENIGAVELATISFGQSFQITPIQLATTASSIVNGGNRVTPHFGVKVVNGKGETVENLQYPVKKGVVSEQTSETMRYILEQVVENGSGKNGYVEGYRVGGKTATSQTLPRGSGRYISSFLGFAPADDPKVLAVAIINNPQGVYYGGQIAAPVVRQLFENILPYLEGMDYNT